jgi:hypothetical protein
MPVKKNPSLDFPEDRRFALQISAQPSRHPWLYIPWQERNTAPEPIKESIPQKTHL